MTGFSLKIQIPRSQGSLLIWWKTCCLNLPHQTKLGVRFGMIGWYGPGGLGSYSTVDGFQEFQVPFKNTFEGWGDGQREGITGVGSNCKAGDGDYVFLSGWPQITGIHVKPFLGIEPTGKRVYMRDCDWWRCKYGKIIENWCMLDILHLVLQLERDILEEISSM